MTGIIQPDNSKGALDSSDKRLKSTLDAYRQARAIKKEASKVKAGSGREAMKTTVETNRGLDDLRDDVEINGGKLVQYYDYAKTTAEGPEVDRMRKLDPVALVGSADADGYKMEWHEPEWYLPFIEDATEISKLDSLLDPTTKKWFDSLKPALDVLVKLGTYNEKDYKRNHKKDIFALVKSKGDKIFYGKEGVLNFLTAFHRTKNICPRLNGADQKDFVATNTGIETIKLMVGEKGGVVEGKDHRFAYMLVKAKQPEISGAPDVDTRFPAIGTEEFFKKYEIGADEIAEFKDLEGKIRIWLKGGNADLTDESFAKTVEYENGLAIFFGDAGNSVNSLLGDLDRFSKNYANFFEDAENPASSEFQGLYLAAVKQKITFFLRYEQKQFEDGGELDLSEKIELKDLYGAVLYLGTRMTERIPGDKAAIASMLEATNAIIDREMYMGQNHLAILERDKAEYEKELAKVAKR